MLRESKSEVFVIEFMQALAGEGVELNPIVKAQASRNLSRLVEVDENDQVTLHRAFDDIAKLFTFRATPRNDQPARGPNAYSEERLAAAKAAAERAISGADDERPDEEPDDAPFSEEEIQRFGGEREMTLLYQADSTGRIVGTDADEVLFREDVNYYLSRDDYEARLTLDFDQGVVLYTEDNTNIPEGAEGIRIDNQSDLNALFMITRDDDHRPDQEDGVTIQDDYDEVTVDVTGVHYDDGLVMAM